MKKQKQDLADNHDHRDEVFSRIDVLLKKYKQLINGEITRAGIYLSQNNMLKYIAVRGSTSQREIAEDMEISAPAVANAVKKIEAKGWVTKKMDARDNRFNVVCITEEGMKVHNQCTEINERMDSLIWEEFTLEEIEQFYYMLVRLDDTLTRMQTEK